MHDAAAGVGAALPAGHFWQANDETLPHAALYVPGAHTLHVGLPRASWYVPTGHCEHFVLPYCCWYVPRGQSVQYELLGVGA